MVRYVLSVVLLVGLASPARGEDACTATVAKVCPQSRGDLLVLSCMRAHEAEIAAACPGDLDAVLAKARELGADCDADAAKLCKDVQPGQGRVATCLKDKESFLSSSCQAAFNEWRLMRMRLTSACAGEIGKLCQMVPEGGGRVWTCLKKNEKDLGSDCRDALKKL